jgi:hypothetical protein
MYLIGISVMVNKSGDDTASPLHNTNNLLTPFNSEMIKKIKLTISRDIN